jgi:mono/diheme cytochrome c family protein
MRAAAASACLLSALALAACGGAPGAGGTGVQDRGAVVYATHCAACHQRDGRGTGNIQPPVAGSATVTGDSRALIAWVMFGQRPTTLAPRKSLAVMPQFNWLSDDDIAAVLTHTRASFGNAAPPISAADVAAVRAAGGR